MTCNCNNQIHHIENVSVTETNVVLTVTNSTNIGSLDCFHLNAGCKHISDFVSGDRLPVQVVVNGETIALLNKYSLPVFSNRVPRRSRGAYVVPDGGSPYVILFDTPCCKCNAK